jgi:hypothetical protein
MFTRALLTKGVKLRKGWIFSFFNYTAHDSTQPLQGISIDFTATFYYRHNALTKLLAPMGLNAIAAFSPQYLAA